VVDPASRKHVLQQELEQALFFRRDAKRSDAPSVFRDVRWIQLSGSGLWVSYGELNSLADNLPPNFDTLPAGIVLPVIQRMRQDTSQKILTLLYSVPADFMLVGFEGATRIGGAKGALFRELGVESDAAIDTATSPLGPDRYLGLVARNACHFAPYSWHRWAAFHQEGRAHALAYYQSAKVPMCLKDVDKGANEHMRQAWLQSGYGDHFLQDSFAAGHLINKTLVMQWFVDYVNGLASKWWDLLGGFLIDATKPWYGIPSSEVMENMGRLKQPEMAGRNLYQPPTGEGTLSDEWGGGFGPTDPQTAYERRAGELRVAGSGVRATPGRSKEQNYQAYLEFLNSSFLQMAAGATHDYLNHRGVLVKNELGEVMRVGGDNTLITKSDQIGAQRAAEAAHMSQRAIGEILEWGSTEITVEEIWKRVPTWVGTEGVDWLGVPPKFYPLETWQEEVLHELCTESIFPDVVDGLQSKGARAISPKVVEGGVGRSLGEITTPAGTPPPPIPDNIGDFVPNPALAQTG
jgi:hypothetical protein